MKKKLLFLSILCCLGLSLCACSKNSGEDASSNKSTEQESNISNGEKSDLDVVFKDIKNLGDINKVDISEYKGLTLTVGKTEITEEDIETEINYLLSENEYYVKNFEGEVKDGDTVNISFVGKIDGVAFEKGSAEDTFLTIGSKSYIEGFETSLIGAEPGETITTNITFPDDYGVETLNGQEAQFDITLNYICGDKVKAELTDEFISTYTDYKTVDEYRAFVRKELEDYYTKDFEENKDSYYWGAVQELLVSNATVTTLDKEDVYEYYLGMVEYYESYAEYFGYSFDKLCETFFNLTADEFKKELAGIAVDYITFNNIVAVIAEKEKLTVSDEEYAKRLDEIVKEYGYSSKDVLLDEIKENKEEERIKLELLQDKVVDLIISSSTVEEITIKK